MIGVTKNNKNATLKANEALKDDWTSCAKALDIYTTQIINSQPDVRKSNYLLETIEVFSINNIIIGEKDERK